MPPAVSSENASPKLRKGEDTSVAACGDTGAVEEGVVGAVFVSVPTSECGERVNEMDGEGAHSCKPAIGICGPTGLIDIIEPTLQML